MQRRPFLAAAAALVTSPALARAPVRTGPLQFGVDDALVASGLAARLIRSFSLETGLQVRLRPGPAAAVLEAVRDGEVDAAMSNAVAAEEALAAKSLVYDRRLVATGEFVLVGPLPVGRGRNPSPPLGSDIGAALKHLRDVALAGQAPLTFLSAGDGSGTHIAELTLWRAAGIAPAPPWYASAGKGQFLSEVRSRNAFALVERAAWSASGSSAGLPIVCAGDPLLAEPVHAMRSFRASHPAAKFFLGWIAGRRGRSSIAALRSYRVAT